MIFNPSSLPITLSDVANASTSMAFKEITLTETILFLTGFPILG